MEGFAKAETALFLASCPGCLDCTDGGGFQVITQRGASLEALSVEVERPSQLSLFEWMASVRWEEDLATEYGVR